MLGRVAAFLSLRLRLIMQTSTMTANTIVPRRVAPMIIPSIASLERPPEELELVEEPELVEELELVGKGRGVVLVAAPVKEGKAAEAVKPKGFVVGSEARVLPIAVM